MTEQTPGDDARTLATEPPPADETFDPGRLRTVREMRRSTDDRMVAGVCAGAARYLRVDPVVVRVVVAALSLVGLVGVVLYVAAWVLVPEEGAEHSIASEHIDGHSENQVRNTGLLIAGVLALVLLLASGTPWGWDTGFFPWVPFWLLVAYLLLVRPWRSRRTRSDAVEQAPARPRGDGTLLALTVCASLVVVGALWALDLSGIDVVPSIYAAAVLSTLGVGLVVGTVVGNARPLVPLGILAGLALLVTSQAPVWSAGQVTETPRTGSELAGTYRLGAGEVRLDLTQLPLSDLDGRTVSVDLGAGHTRIEVPDGVDLHVDVDNVVGEVVVLDHVEDGFDNDYRMDEASSDIDLTLRIDHRAGQVEVLRP